MAAGLFREEKSFRNPNSEIVNLFVLFVPQGIEDFPQNSHILDRCIGYW